jgi:hypothetical protein
LPDDPSLSRRRWASPPAMSAVTCAHRRHCRAGGRPCPG